MPLIFSELFHKTALCSQANLGVPGVYIWGFIYEKDRDKIGDPVNFSKIGSPIADPDKHVFIPYYVGESSSSILSRLFEHIQPQKSPSSKKTRLTIDYIKCFFNDVDFPINSGLYLGIRNFHGMSVNSNRFYGWIELNNITNNELQYFNNEIIMQLLYPNNLHLITYNNPTNNNFPITLPVININDQQDSLNQLITHQANFFFTYCKLNPSTNPTKEIETYTTLSLKGKTLAEITGVPRCMQEMNAGNFHNIVDNTGFDIFKQPDAIRLDLNRPFELGNIDFPGYL